MAFTTLSGTTVGKAKKRKERVAMRQGEEVQSSKEERSDVGGK